MREKGEVGLIETHVNSITGETHPCHFESGDNMQMSQTAAPNMFKNEECKILNPYLIS